MRNPDEVVFAILSLHWVASALRSAIEEGVPVAVILDAVTALSTAPACFVLRGCEAYEQQLSNTISEHDVLAFARGAFAQTGLFSLSAETHCAADDFFWSWDAFFRTILELNSPSEARLVQAFEAVENLPLLFVRDGPHAFLDRLRVLANAHPELRRMIHSYEV